MLGTVEAAVALGLIKAGTGRFSSADAQGTLRLAGSCSHITHNQHQAASSYGEKENFSAPKKPEIFASLDSLAFSFFVPIFSLA